MYHQQDNSCCSSLVWSTTDELWKSVSCFDCIMPKLLFQLFVRISLGSEIYADLYEASRAWPALTEATMRVYILHIDGRLLNPYTVILNNSVSRRNRQWNPVTGIHRPLEGLMLLNSCFELHGIYVVALSESLWLSTHTIFISSNHWFINC